MYERKITMISYILAAVVGIIVIAVDQYTKYFVANNFTLGEGSKVLIPKIIDLIYVKNDGGAWGMLGGSTWLLLSLTVIIMLICITLLLKYGTKNKFMFWAISLIIAGGLGNMIDRIFRGGYVVDFLHFTFFDSFPVFNIADCSIVIGGGMLLLYLVLGIVKESKKNRAQKAQNSKNEEI